MPSTTLDPGPRDWNGSLSICNRNDQQLMSKANLGSIHGQADFPNPAQLFFQPMTGNRFVPFAHPDSRVVQQPAHSSCSAGQLCRSRYLTRYFAHMHRSALINTNDQPDETSHLSDPLAGSQLSNSLVPYIIQLVDRHVTSPGKGFCGKNDFTRFCAVDQLFFC